MKTLLATPVKLACLELQIPYREEIGADLRQFDLGLVADYGRILPTTVLEQPQYGFWNLHPSLLPKYRGSTPLQTALLHNEKITGVTLFKLDEKMDHGPLIAQAQVDIDPAETYLSLLDKTASGAAKLFNNINLEKFPLTPQNHSQATYTKKLTKADGFVPIEQLVPYLTPILKKFNLLHILSPLPAGSSSQAEPPIDPARLNTLIRALSPWPGVWSKSGEKVIKIYANHLEINGKSYY
jgi:methionyl-tRNA formyltransferase